MNSVSGIIKKKSFCRTYSSCCYWPNITEICSRWRFYFGQKRNTVCNNARRERFGISLNNIFLPIQLDYSGKSEQSFPRYKSLDEFSLSINSTHYFHSMESIKLTDEVIVPYLKNKVQNISLPPIHKGFLIRSIVK